MGDIYEIAFIVIAATKSQNGSLGCHSQTEPSYAATVVSGYGDVYNSSASAQVSNSLARKSGEQDIVHTFAPSLVLSGNASRTTSARLLRQKGRI